MDLYPVKARLFRVLCGKCEHLHIAWDFLSAERARDFVGLVTLRGVGRLIADSLGAARNRLLTLVQQRMRGTAGMPDLHEDPPAFGMDRLRHPFPAGYMCGTVNATFTHEGTSMGIDHGAFRHDEAARCTS